MSDDERPFQYFIDQGARFVKMAKERTDALVRELADEGKRARDRVVRERVAACVEQLTNAATDLLENISDLIGGTMGEAPGNERPGWASPQPSGPRATETAGPAKRPAGQATSAAGAAKKAARPVKKAAGPAKKTAGAAKKAARPVKKAAGPAKAAGSSAAKRGSRGS